MKVTDPILSCKEAGDYEKSLLKNQREELEAMSRAGEGVAKAVYKEFGSMLGKSPVMLVIAGKGHNGGDALCAARALLKKIPDAVLKVFLASDIEKLKTNTAYFARLTAKEGGSVRFIKKEEILKGADLMLEGLLGMSFKPPMRENLIEILNCANSSPCRIKASIDLPAGLGDEHSDTVFQADVTYMTGIAKKPVFDNAEYAGRMRYIDLGFFDGHEENAAFGIVSEKASGLLKKLRNAQTDKRGYGHLFVFAGSSNYPGAALMNVKAALRSGVGLVSAFVPESVASAFASAEPACIWIPCPETEEGSLSLETFSLFKSMRGKATAVLAGSGLGESSETAALISEILKAAAVPCVLDADAVRPGILDNSCGKNILITPHAGEFLRLAKDSSDSSLLELCSSKKINCVLKGSVSRISDGRNIAHVCAGGPQLARAGSGDILAGLVSGLAAREDLGMDLYECACAASLWAGRAGECAFAERGENAYASSDVFNFLPQALNE